MKELVHAVFGVDVKEYKGIFHDKMWYVVQGDSMSSYMNTFEFQSRCKTWAIENAYEIKSGPEIDGIKMEYNAEVVWAGEEAWNSKDFYAETEHEAVFKACEWVLKDLKDA